MRMTPWGMSDFEERVGTEGIVSVLTPSHGGYFVPKRLLHRIPAAHQAYATKWSGSPQWYEEDCAWACVVVAFPELFTAEQIDAARHTVARWVDGCKQCGGELEPATHQVGTRMQCVKCGWSQPA